MATQQLNPNEKKVSLVQIVEDLNDGLSKWKKDDIGFGSIEKKYNLTSEEAIELFGHPKIKNKEPKVPTFIIVDDLPDEEPVVNNTVAPQEIVETRVVVAPTIVRPSVQVVREEAPKKKAEAFI